MRSHTVLNRPRGWNRLGRYELLRALHLSWILLDDKDEREVGRPTVSKALEDAQSSVQQLHNASATAVTYTNIVGNASTALDQIDAFNATYLQPLKVFNAFVNTIANVCANGCCG